MSEEEEAAGTAMQEDVGPAAVKAPQPLVTVELLAHASDSLSMRLHVCGDVSSSNDSTGEALGTSTTTAVAKPKPGRKSKAVASAKGRPAAVGREVETDSSPLVSESDEEEEGKKGGGGGESDSSSEALDYEEMRELITRAYAVAEEEEDDEEGPSKGAGKGGGRGPGITEALVGGGPPGGAQPCRHAAQPCRHTAQPCPPPSSCNCSCLPLPPARALETCGACCCTPLQCLPPLEPLGDLEVAPGDTLESAGSVLSVLEGLVVVQGLAHSRALAEGWVRSVAVV